MHTTVVSVRKTYDLAAQQSLVEWNTVRIRCQIFNEQRKSESVMSIETSVQRKERTMSSSQLGG
jgi:hypothetical protein